MLEPYVYEWLTEQMILCKHKNISHTVNYVVKNYLSMIKAMERTHKNTENLEKARQEAEEMVNKYRGQIVK